MIRWIKIESAIIILAFSGCAYVPPARVISSHFEDDNKIVLITHSHTSNDVDIRTFDISKEAFVRRTTIDNIKKNDVIDLFFDDNKIFMSVKNATDKYIHERYPALYVINLNGSKSLIGQLDGDIVGMDDKYFYVVKREGDRLVPIRYDKNLKNRMDYHFADRPDLVVMKLDADDNKYWFTCFRNPIGRPGDLFGKIDLVIKTKGTNRFDYFFYDKTIRYDFRTAIDSNALWIFYDSIVKFSKSTSEFSETTLFRYLNPISSSLKAEEASFFWAYTNDAALYNFNNKNLELLKTKRSFSPDIDLKSFKHKYNFNRLSPINFDGKYFWMIGEKRRSFSFYSKNEVPYLVKINKDEPDKYSEVLLKPTAFEAVKVMAINFFGDVFIMPYLLIFGPESF